MNFNESLIDRMQINPKLYAILSLCLFTMSMHGQSKALAKADEKFKSYAFIDAQKIYLKLAAEGFTSAELFKKLGDSYYFNGKYEDSGKWYAKLTGTYPAATPPEYYFRYSQGLKAMGDYALADAMMGKFRELKGGDSRAELLARNPDYLEDISYIESDYEVENLKKINSRYSDFGAALYKDRLIFASARDTGIFRKKRHKWNNQPFLDFYSVRILEEGRGLSRVEPFASALNSPYHESSPAFTSDGNTMYFTRNNYHNGSKHKDKTGTVRLKVFVAQWRGDNWSPPRELPFNDDGHSVSHPALSPDGRTLYFASDMQGTHGLSDLWKVAILGNGEYGEPVNLGPDINTEGRENFPHVSQRGNLYYSSDGRPGLGGLDVYVVATKKNGAIASIINLGEPINSPQDDFAFILDRGTQLGYFSSNRYYGMGSDDLFKFIRQPKKQPVCNSGIIGFVKDKETQEPLDNATITLLDLQGNERHKLNAGTYGDFVLSPSCGQEILIRAEAPNYYSAEKIVNAPAEGGKLDIELLLEPRIKPINEGDDLANLLQLKPIYFDFDRFDIRRDAAEELTKVLAVMESNPSLIIDIRSHTDSRGNDAYNLNLSSKRAQSTVDYIVSRGIDRKRITGEGYGEKQPINACTNGIECSDDDHQLNRRSEFIVLGY